MENDNKELKEETTKKEADKKETESKEETKQPVEETAVQKKRAKMDWYCSSCSCSNSIGIWWCGNLLPVSFPESYLYQ